MYRLVGLEAAAGLNINVTYGINVNVMSVLSFSLYEACVVLSLSAYRKIYAVALCNNSLI